MFSRQKLELVKNRINIVDLVGKSVTLRKKGGSYVGLCPFHADVHPSLSVNGHKQLFKCFSCGIGGDIFQFWSKINQLSFEQSVVNLADQVGIKINHYRQEPNWSCQQQKILKINNDFMRYCFNFLFSDYLDARTALDYLGKRHLSRATIAKFKIGFCPGEPQVMNFLFEQGYTLRELNASGLIQIIEGRKFCAFANRIIFPIFNAWNVVVGFSARTIKPKVQSKYINSIDTAVFHKSNLLYNWQSVAHNQINTLIICEGVFDVVALTQAKISNCVGLLGTNFSPEHVKKIKQKRCSILLWLDSDRAGQVATMKIARQLLMAQIKVKIYPINSQIKDPADIVTQSQFNGLIKQDQWQHPVQFAINFFKSQLNINQPTSVQNFMTNVNPFLKLETEPVMFNSFVQQISKLLRLPVAVLKEIIKSPIKQHNIQQSDRVTTPDGLGLSKAESRLLWLGWHRRQDFYQIDKIITIMQTDNVWFSQNYYVIWRELKRYYDNQSLKQGNNITDLSRSQQLHFFNSQVIQKMNKILQTEQSCSHRWDNQQEIKDCVLKIKKNHLKALSIKMIERKESANNDDEKIKISDQILKLRQKIHE